MTQIQKASSGADTRQCRRETSWSCLVLDGVDYQRMLEGQKAEPARTPIIRVIIYLWQQWSLSKRGDTGRVKGEKDRSIVTSGDLKAHFTEIHQEIHTAGLRKPEETSNTHVWADPSGTWPLAVGTAPSSQACICSAREHIYPAPLLPPPPTAPPLFTAYMKTPSWCCRWACSLESPLWLSMSRRGLLENLYTHLTDVQADERRPPFFCLFVF